MAKDKKDATQLKDMQVSFLSIVRKGANGKKIIWKSDAQAAEGAEELSVALRDIRKSDEKQMVFGVVYAPDQVDTQGEFAKAEDIEAAAYGFMKSKNVLNVDANHDFDPKTAYVAESWIIKGVDSLFDKEPEGTWCVGIKVEDAELWEQVKKGELEGISMAGAAVKIRKAMEGAGLVEELKKKIDDLMKSIKEPDKKEDSVKKDADTQKNESEGEKETAITKEQAESIVKALGGMQELIDANKKLSERVEELEKSTNGKQGAALGGSAGGNTDVDYSDIV